jgi:hypothetical protein
MPKLLVAYMTYHIDGRKHTRRISDLVYAEQEGKFPVKDVDDVGERFRVVVNKPETYGFEFFLIEFNTPAEYDTYLAKGEIEGKRAMPDEMFDRMVLNEADFHHFYAAL